MGNSVTILPARNRLYMCLLALSAAAIVQTTAAHAQSALSTVAYITLGLEPKAGEYGVVFTDKGKSVDIKQTMGDTISFEQISNCMYRIQGVRFYADVRTEVDYTVDFTNMRRSYTPTADDDEARKVKWIYLTVPGVRTCSKKALTVKHFERFPRTGECRDYLETAASFDRFAPNHLQRMESALDYFSKTYCKGSAF